MHNFFFFDTTIRNTETGKITGDTGLTGNFYGRIGMPRYW